MQEFHDDQYFDVTFIYILNVFILIIYELIIEKFTYFYVFCVIL